MSNRASLLVALIAAAPLLACGSSDPAAVDDAGGDDGSLEGAPPDGELSDGYVPDGGGETAYDSAADSAADTNVPDGAPPPCAPDATLPGAPSSGPAPMTQVTAILAGSGIDTSPIPALAPLTDAIDPSDPKLTSLLHVGAPNGQCTHLVHLVSPAIAIPTRSTVREVELWWKGKALPLIDQGKSEVTETPHSYGEQIPFFKPVFSLEGAAPGIDALEVRGYDGAHTLVTTVSIPGMQVVPSPAPLAACQLTAVAHPRIWATKSRLAKAAGRPASDPAKKRFDAAIQYFRDALVKEPDVLSSAFSSAVYDPESYIPALALCYQLSKAADATRANECAASAKTLALNIANEYESGKRSFGRDTGYDIRFGLMQLMIAYDWLYDKLGDADKKLLVKVGTDWVDWYHANGYAESHPYENYYAGWIQGLTLTTIATAGDNSATDRLVSLLSSKLYWEMPVLNQRLCGGDWPEGWNYGPYSVMELTLVKQTLLDFGADWGPLFDWAGAEPRWATYQMSPGFTDLRSFGGYSGNVPHKTSPALLAVQSSTTADGPLAARLYASTLAEPSNDLSDGTRGFTAFEMLYADTSATADVSKLPLSYLASGTGRFVSKSSLSDPGAYQVTAENISYYYDHYGYANGDVRLYKGEQCLLCPSAYRGPSFGGEDTTPAFSTYLVNGKEQGSGDRDNQVLFSLEGGSWSAIGMRFEASYTNGQYDEGIIDAGNALDYLIREAVHVRPGTLVVRDLHRRKHAGDTLVARWHLGSTATATSPSANVWDVGGLKITLLGGFTAKPTFAPESDSGSTVIGTLMTETLPAGPTTEVEMVRVFSETDTGVSYSGGVLKLSSGTCVTFAAGTVDVKPCP